MRIGINTLFILPGKVGGTETYVRGLIHGLTQVDKKNEYVLFTHNENHHTFEYNSGQFSKKLCPVPVKSRLARVAYEQMVVPRLVVKHGTDILHSPGYVSPIVGKFGKIVTIHDMQYHYYPENFPKARLFYWKHFVPLSARRADIVITVSNNSKKDIVELLKVPAEKVVVTYESSKFAGDLDAFEFDEQALDKHGIRSKYILSVGSLLPGKNLDKLIEAFSLIMDKTEHQLVLAGMNGHAIKSVRNVLMEKEIGRDRVMLLGRVSDELLFSLYKNAALFVLPSLFEGFGIPLVEAMSLGCPVAASDRTSIPEVVGDAAVLFDPEVPERIGEAMISVLSDRSLRSGLVRRGLERAKLFSWEKMAQETLGAYDRAYDVFHKDK